MIAPICKIANRCYCVSENDRKVSSISRPKGVSIRTALVFDGSIAPTVEANGYFDAIVPFHRLLDLP